MFYGDKGLKLDKRSYRRVEVQALLDGVINDYESKLFEQKNRISDLIVQNEKLIRKNDYFQRKEELITETLKNATKKAQEIIEDANIIYNIASERLAILENNIEVYCKKYLSGMISPKKAEKIKAIKSELTAIAKSSKNDEERVVKATKVFANSKVIEIKDDRIPELKRQKNDEFNPEMLIKEYFESASSSGFNMEEITNAKDADLEDLCKEMGLTEKK